MIFWREVLYEPYFKQKNWNVIRKEGVNVHKKLLSASIFSDKIHCL